MAEDRLGIANPPESKHFPVEPANHPIHLLYKNDEIEEKVSKYFKKAFGEELVVHRAAGSRVPLYTEKRPALLPGEDRVSLRYITELEKLVPLHQQGDGMRSFAGVLLHALLDIPSILLIDEPEAFLHPPQARLIGKMLAQDKQDWRQLFLATHSGDLLRGLLDAETNNVRVVRISRKGNINYVKELVNEELSRVWKDPLLRYSNILDGLFHEFVILCESDADCRFYAAIMDTLFDENAGISKPDIMFVNCGGKHRFPIVINALRKIGVPVCVVADFDILSEGRPLRETYEFLGGDWRDLHRDWKSFKKFIEQKRPELNTEEVKRELESILSKINTTSFPADAVDNIRKILKRSTPWSSAKTGGKSCVPSGDVYQQ